MDKKYIEVQPGNTEYYEPPKYVAKPQPGDLIITYMTSQFLNQKFYFVPGIKSVNHDLANMRNQKEEQYK